MERFEFSGVNIPPSFSENLGLKPPLVSPRLDFPNSSLTPQGFVRGLFRKVHFLENLESNHLLENLEILEIVEILPVKRPLS